MTDAVLAVDIGGTKTAAALVDRDGRMLRSGAAPTPGADGPGAIIDTALRLARGVIGDGVAVRAIGVGTAGVVDVGAGTIVSSTATLAGWAGTEVAARVADGLADAVRRGIPVHVQNDVDAFAVGELRFGAARGRRSALVLAVGTGVGASVIIDGRVLRGSHHVAGEIAHVPISGADHLDCPCGRAGHLEALGSGVGLHRHYLSLGGDAAASDGRAVAERAAAGEALAVRAVQESAAGVGRGIAAVVTVLDPEIVVVSGSVVGAGPLWWEAMDTALRAQLIDALQQLPVVRGELGGDAPLRGAAASAWELWEGQS